MGESENPNLRLRSSLELWSRSWHGWFVEQSFLVRNLFHNNIFLDVLFMRLDGERRLSRCLPIIITFVPNHHLQCLYFVFPIMRCAFCSYQYVGLAERRIPCRFVENLTFPLLKRRNPSRPPPKVIFCGSKYDSLSYSLVPLFLPPLT